MRFSLQQMVQKTLAEAEEREKIAQEAESASNGSDAKKDEKGIIKTDKMALNYYEKILDKPHTSAIEFGNELAHVVAWES